MDDGKHHQKPGTLMLLINTGLSFLLPFIGLQVVCVVIPMARAFHNKMPPGDLIWYSAAGLGIGAVVGVANAALYLRRQR